MSCRLATNALTSSAVSFVVGVLPRKASGRRAPGRFRRSNCLPLRRLRARCGRCAIAVELLVEHPDAVSDLLLACFLVGVGLSGVGEFGAGVVEVVFGEELGHPGVKLWNDAVLADVLLPTPRG